MKIVASRSSPTRVQTVLAKANASLCEKQNPLIGKIWKKLSPTDKSKPHKLKKTWAYMPSIAKAIGVEHYDKFSLLDLTDDQLEKLATLFGIT